MKPILCAVLYLLINNIVKSENPFKSIPVVVKTYENETVLLPCYIDESEVKLRVRWYKDEELLGDNYDMHRLLPPRVRMHSNHSLQVDMLQAGDTADYTCEIIRPEPWGPIRQTHYIEVQYPPSVQTIPDSGFLEVERGQEVNIACEATGTPKPFIDWKKNGQPMNMPTRRSRLTFKADHHLLGGHFECIANNGVGNPARAIINVVIKDAPIVSTDRASVHTAVGLRATISAKVDFAHPQARVAWYKDGRRLRPDERMMEVVSGNSHQLIFRSVRQSDLGKYLFRAINPYGMADINFILTAVPNVATFKVDVTLNKATPISFTLIWEVDSYTPIIEYNLWLRPYYGRLDTTEPDAFTTEAPVNRWRKIVVPGDSSEGPIHSAAYTVTGLTPSTVYDALVTSRNKFGWSKPSTILHFATEAGVGGTKPATADYTEIMPMLETPTPHNYSNGQLVEYYDLTSKGARETPCWATMFYLFCTVFSFSFICSGYDVVNDHNDDYDVIDYDSD